MMQSYFTTDAYPAHRKIGAWREALSHFHLDLKNKSVHDSFYSAFASTTTPQGIRLGLLASGPQAWAYCACGHPNGLSLALHLEGEAFLTSENGRVSLQPRDVVFVPHGAQAEISLVSQSRQLLVNVPHALLQTRLASPLAPSAGRIEGRSVDGYVLSGLLESTSAVIEDLNTDQLQSLDIALPEFLSACLALKGTNMAGIARTSATTATLHRISQHIEGQLSDPDLSLAKVAAEVGVSERYLQKLFESVSDKFGNYVKMRRLERCRMDLINPLYMHLSVTDILFRWGFNDASYFSRVFRQQYKTTPRTYRQEGSRQIAERSVKTSSRGWPDITHGDYMKLVRDEVSPAETWQRRKTEPDIWAAGGVSKLNGASHYHLAANEKTVHWGYLSYALPPILEIDSGDYVTIEALSHHCGDDYERMIKGDSGVESVYRWTEDEKAVDRRGAGPMGANIYGRGAGEGFGVHICTGPVLIRDAEPGDVLEIKILDARPRPSANARYADRAYGSNAATWWGLHYKEMRNPREVVTIYEIDCSEDGGDVRPLYSFPWTPQTDPHGVSHETIDYPGVCVDHSRIEKNNEIMPTVSLPLQPHFGMIAVAPKEADLVDATPPSYFGGNLDDRRMGKGATLFLPVSVAGALLSVGSPRVAKGDGQIGGTAVECSLTGLFQIVLHKKYALAGKPFSDLDHPLLETQDEWVVHGFTSSNYLAELGQTAQSEIYKRSSLDPAMRDAMRKMRRFLITAKGLSEDEAISLMSTAVDFGVSQVVDGNWCVHATLRKSLFSEGGAKA